MLNSRRSLAVLLAAAALSFSAILPALPTFQDAEEATEPRKVTYALKDGKHVRGTILEAEADRVRIKVALSGGSSTRWFDLADFDEHSQVRLRRDVLAEGDLAGQLAVAEFAGSLGLVDMSRTELRRCAHMAESAAGDLPEGFETRAFQLTLQLLETLSARGDVSEARSAVSRVLTRYPDRLSPENQEQMLHVVETGAKQHNEAQTAARNAKQDAKAVKLRENQLKGVHSKLEKGEKHRRKGLLGSRKYSAANRDLKSAVKFFESALDETKRLDKKFSHDDIMLAELNALGSQALAQAQDCLLSSASLDLARGSFNRAMESVNRILVDDPKHKQALAMRQRIEVAQSDWGWDWGGRRR